MGNILLNPLLPVVISAATAFVVAVAGQILSHWFSLKRESRKLAEDVYVKFFLPILVDVFTFMDMQSNPRKGHDVMPEQESAVYQRITSHIRENIVYASPKLLLKYQQILSFRMGDETGFASSINEIELIYWFLKDVEKTLLEFGRNDNRVGENIRTVRRYSLLYLLWIVASKKARDLEIGRNIVTRSCSFKEVKRLEFSAIVNYLEKRNDYILQSKNHKDYEELVDYVGRTFLKRSERKGFFEEVMSMSESKAFVVADASYDDSYVNDYYKQSLYRLINHRDVGKRVVKVLVYSNIDRIPSILGFVEISIDEKSVFYVDNKEVLEIEFSDQFSFLRCEGGEVYHILTSNLRNFSFG